MLAPQHSTGAARGASIACRHRFARLEKVSTLEGLTRLYAKSPAGRHVLHRYAMPDGGYASNTRCGELHPGTFRRPVFLID